MLHDVRTTAPGAEGLSGWRRHQGRCRRCRAVSCVRPVCCVPPAPLGRGCEGSPPSGAVSASPSWHLRPRPSLCAARVPCASSTRLGLSHLGGTPVPSTLPGSICPPDLRGCWPSSALQFASLVQPLSPEAESLGNKKHSLARHCPFCQRSHPGGWGCQTEVPLQTACVAALMRGRDPADPARSGEALPGRTSLLAPPALPRRGPES